MDFVVGLLKTLAKFDSIWVIIDRFTKSAHLIPVQITYTTQKLAQIYIREIVHLHGTDSHSERMIQVPEDMLRACMIDFGGHWDQFLPLAKFAYSNSYHLSIDMAPFETLYGRRCRSPIGWFDAFEVRPWATDLLRESLDKVKGLVLLDENLEEPVAILDREVRKLRSKEIATVKVQWKNRPVKQATWETKSDIRNNYPQLFTESGTFSLVFLPCLLGDERLFNWY
ncbi:uncharacterized protein LOC132038528 [Lycium ferocissimum]|uniref:uncharacterized protein LOC132038528 n=1 Tax=Lycium ferocissimum TaxID=112874 RepID=UPI00281677A4|nr:uncharacterized protein LOC132038528 [Lycium ferocissimum]